MRAARSHPWLIAAVTAVAVLCSVAFLATRGRDYEASTQVLVTPLSDVGSYAGLPVLTSSVDPTRTQQTAASVLDTSTAAAAAARAVPGWTPGAVSAAVKVEPQGESSIVTVTATADSPATAQTLANRYTAAALDARSRTLRSQVGASITALEQERKALTPGDTASASEIAGELSDLRRIANGQDPNFSLLQRAGPGVATGSSAALIVVLALIAGLVLGIGAAVLAEQLNRRVRDEDEVESIYPLPVLTRVPRTPAGAEQVVTPELVPPRMHEAFRTLTALLSKNGEGGWTIMVTSASKGDGKTTAALHLAMALCAARERVILLDLDLRKPEIGARLGVQSDVMGLFRPRATLRDVLAGVPSVPGLSVLGSQPRDNVLPVLEALTRRIPELMAEARQLASYVIVDTPPLGEVSDALRIAGSVDEILLVVRPGHTDRTDLQHTRELLDAMAQTPSGLVVVGQEDVSRRDAYGYGPAAAPPTPTEFSQVMALDAPATGEGQPQRTTRAERRRRARST